jgi:hypothetical protein
MHILIKLVLASLEALCSRFCFSRSYSWTSLCSYSLILRAYIFIYFHVHLIAPVVYGCCIMVMRCWCFVKHLLSHSLMWLIINWLSLRLNLNFMTCPCAHFIITKSDAVVFLLLWALIVQVGECKILWTYQYSIRNAIT